MERQDMKMQRGICRESDCTRRENLTNKIFVYPGKEGSSMNQEIKEQLSAAGVNVAGALERLMNNEMLLERLLIKFKADTNFAGLKKALEEKQYEDAFHCAHTLKGVAGNLGLEKLMNADSVVVEKLRSQSYEGIEEDMRNVEEAYMQLLDIIQKIG